MVVHLLQSGNYTDGSRLEHITVLGPTMLPHGQTQSELQNRPVHGRNREMCRRCRHDKQRCTPVDRQWEKNEKCRRCEKLGYSCGPSERASRKEVTRPPAEWGGRTTNVQISSSNLSPIECSALKTLPPSRVTDTLMNNTKFRSIAILGKEDTGISSKESTPGIQVGAEHGLLTSRKNTEGEARALLARLGNLIAVRELLRSELRFVDDIGSWIGTAKTLDTRNDIQSTVRIIHKEFAERVNSAQPFAAKDLGPAKELFLSQLVAIQYRFHHPPSLGSVLDGRIDYDMFRQEGGCRFQEMLYSLQRKKGGCSFADYICGAVCEATRPGHLVYAGSEAELVDSYKKASDDICSLLSELMLESLAHSVSQPDIPASVCTTICAKESYPACHLAARQGNAAILLELWQSQASRMWAMDSFLRTPVHVAAYAGNLIQLQKVFERDKMTASMSGKDCFGLTPLMIAACRDDVKAFGLLLKHGVDYMTQDHEGRDLFEMAVCAGSTKVVRYLLGLRSDLIPTIATLVHQSILADHKDTATVLIKYWKSTASGHPSDIEQCINAAKYRGFLDLVSSLLDMEPAHNSRNDALISLDTEWLEPSERSVHEQVPIWGQSFDQIVCQSYQAHDNEISVSDITQEWSDPVALPDLCQGFISYDTSYSDTTHYTPIFN